MLPGRLGGFLRVVAPGRQQGLRSRCKLEPAVKRVPSLGCYRPQALNTTTPRRPSGPRCTSLVLRPNTLCLRCFRQSRLVQNDNQVDHSVGRSLAQSIRRIPSLVMISDIAPDTPLDESAGPPPPVGAASAPWCSRGGQRHTRCRIVTPDAWLLAWKHGSSPRLWHIQARSTVILLPSFGQTATHLPGSIVWTHRLARSTPTVA